jgi:hypothetical protein
MLVRFSEPMPDYWKDAQEMVRTGRISQHFEPSGYAALIAVGMELGRNHAEFGVEVEQAILHILTVVLVWALMRRLGATALGALSGGVIVALHPELLLGLGRRPKHAHLGARRVSGSAAAVRWHFVEHIVTPVHCARLRLLRPDQLPFDVSSTGICSMADKK